MRVPLLSAIVLSLAVGVAFADDSAPRKADKKAEKKGPTRLVRIESLPKGAIVFIGAKKDGPDGKTPLEIELPLGETELRIELENYVPVVDSLVVKQARRKEKGKPQVSAWTLVEALGAIAVEGPKGAKVLVDGEEVGSVPGTYDVSAGPHTVALAVDGEEIKSKKVVVTEGDEPTSVSFSTEASTAEPAPPARTTEDPADTAAVGASRPAAVITKPSSPKKAAKAPLAVASATYNFTTRTFRYVGDDPTTMLVGTPRTFVHMLGVAVGLFPFRPTGITFLHPLSLHGSYSFGVPVPVETANFGFSTENPPETFQQVVEASLRYRIAIGRFGVSPEVGYGAYQYRFTAVEADVARLPDMSYSTVRLGSRFGRQLGPLETYLAGEYIHVLTAGRLHDAKFPQGRNGLGFGGKVGGALPLGSYLHAGFEGGFSYFRWAYTTTPGNENEYTGSTDRVISIGAHLGGHY